MCKEIKSTPENDPYSFRMHCQKYHLFHRYIQMKQRRQDMDSFVFSTILEQQKKGL
jgi:hypothetical protein